MGSEAGASALASAFVAGPAELSLVDDVHEALESLWQQAPGVGDEDRMLFALAVSEVATNVVEHAEGAAPAQVTVTLTVDASALTAVLTDDADPALIRLNDVSMPDSDAESGRGLALALTSGQQVINLPAGSSFFTFLGGTTLGVATSVWVLAGVVVVLTVVLRMTPFGYRVRSIGSNPEAATFSGISVGLVRMQALVLIGLLAGLAGALGLAFFISGDPNIGTGFELQAIAAAVIGGTPLRGGSATVVGAVLGAILLSAVNSGLAYFNVPVNWSNFATGAVILTAVALDSLIRGRRRHRRAALDG